MLGPPPQDFLERAPKSNMYFQPDGMLRFWEYTAHTTCLAECTNFPDGEEKEMFVAFLGSMIQWCPENRKTASELLRDPWLYT
ncbi:hypothetical protein N7492_001678 [Penicillium capsulatum]|uniref:Protein kinase domain-containing protein n=1 Tax=Penicillium capsulatum TaxID=69766 RepID=A0A9W9IU93_9EURO|nr:hypothetical protein N7492_001678 [Penicillium capsulatum]